jgi:hypothetical protein
METKIVKKSQFPTEQQTKLKVQNFLVLTDELMLPSWSIYGWFFWRVKISPDQAGQSGLRSQPLGNKN